MATVAEMKQVFEGAKRLVIYLHDNPDPDAIASAWLLALIAESAGLKAVMVHGGRLGRAENRAMVRLLRIPLKSLADTRLRTLKTDRFAMVDTQPHAGNNSFPADRLRCHIIIDHHPSRVSPDGDFVDIRPDDGCTTTMVLGYFDEQGLELRADLATAVAYAIASETQDLEREATRADREVYQRVLPMVHLSVLGRIRHPTRSRTYYQAISRAMSRVQVARNTCVCHMGQVAEAEVVAEVADLLAAMERISWCLVSGLHCQSMVLSMRTRKVDGRAGQKMRRMLSGMGLGGGHGMIAGGAVDCADEEEYRTNCEKVTARFLKQLRSRAPVVLHPLLKDSDKLSDGCSDPESDEEA